jgi:hypothetical protein
MTDKIKAVGSKAEVFHNSAKHTSGGLKKSDLMMTKRGRIVSKKQHKSGLKAIKRLFAAGYKPKKGTFKLFHKSAKKSGTKKRRSTRRRGGFTDGSGNGMNPMAGVMKAAVHTK